MKQPAQNSLNGGLLMDMNPLTTPNDTMTYCLNGTIITFNGNEFVLQNDLGNIKLDEGSLKEGYIPLAMKEYGGIIYIVSTNPLDNTIELGSFPSPGLPDNIEDQCTPVTINNSKLNSYNTIALSDLDLKIRAGDKFKLDLGSYGNYSQWFSDDNNKRIFKLDLVKIDTNGNVTDISSKYPNWKDNVDYVYYKERSSGTLALLLSMEPLGEFTINTGYDSIDENNELGTFKKTFIPELTTDNTVLALGGYKLDYQITTEDEGGNEIINPAEVKYNFDMDNKNCYIDGFTTKDKIRYSLTPYSQYAQYPNLKKSGFIDFGALAKKYSQEVWRYSVGASTISIDFDFNFYSPNKNTESLVGVYLEFYDMWSKVSTLYDYGNPDVQRTLKFSLEEFTLSPSFNSITLGGIPVSSTIKPGDADYKYPILTDNGFSIEPKLSTVIKKDIILRKNTFYLVRLCGVVKYLDVDGTYKYRYNNSYNTMLTNGIFNDLYDISDPTLYPNFSVLNYSDITTSPVSVTSALDSREFTMDNSIDNTTALYASGETVDLNTEFKCTKSITGSLTYKRTININHNSFGILNSDIINKEETLLPQPEALKTELPSNYSVGATTGFETKINPNSGYSVASNSISWSNNTATILGQLYFNTSRSIYGKYTNQNPGIKVMGVGGYYYKSFADFGNLVDAPLDSTKVTKVTKSWMLDGVTGNSYNTRSPLDHPISNRNPTDDHFSEGLRTLNSYRSPDIYKAFGVLEVVDDDIRLNTAEVGLGTDKKIFGRDSIRDFVVYWLSDTPSIHMGVDADRFNFINAGGSSYSVTYNALQNKLKNMYYLAQNVVGTNMQYIYPNSYIYNKAFDTIYDINFKNLSIKLNDGTLTKYTDGNGGYKAVSKFNIAEEINSVTGFVDTNHFTLGNTANITNNIPDDFSSSTYGITFDADTITFSGESSYLDLSNYVDLFESSESDIKNLLDSSDTSREYSTEEIKAVYNKSIVNGVSAMIMDESFTVKTFTNRGATIVTPITRESVINHVTTTWTYGDHDRDAPNFLSIKIDGINSYY